MIVEGKWKWKKRLETDMFVIEQAKWKWKRKRVETDKLLGVIDQEKTILGNVGDPLARRKVVNLILNLNPERR